MRVAIPQWQNWVSPVFDVAGTLVVVDMEAGMETGRQKIALLDEDRPLDRVHYLKELKVDVLVCGAISRPLEQALLSAGIKVIPQTCGEIDQIVVAYKTGQLKQGSYAMPGCRGQRHRFRGGRFRS